MTDSTWQREKALFLAALDVAPSDRDAWLDASTGDSALREAVRSLLAAHAANEASDEFLETPAIALQDDALNDLPRGLSRLGSYALQREIGRGGMGAVYLASRTDGEFKRDVAVKLVKRGMDTDAIVARFRHERQILAGLEHPNIARLIDGGTTSDGRPYFVMEYVHGMPVREFVESRKLSLDDRLSLFRTICGAVEHAHRNLVVHRDLKSSNILVTSEGVPKLLDFGIAKLLSSSANSDTATVATIAALTPEYASPEQLRGESVTTATDVYSLGVLLYELLTGQRPYETSSKRIDEVAQLVSDSTPTLPSELVRAKNPKLAQRLRGDLDTIVRKAMHPDIVRRYPSVSQFADDIERFQTGFAVQARGDSFRYRASTFARRHRPGVAAVVILALTIAGGVATTLYQSQRANMQRARAERRFAEVRSLATSFLFDVHDAIRTLPGATPARAMLVKRGLDALNGLARDADGDPALQRELAIAYQRVGDVQGNSYGANLGDTPGALESYRKAVALLEGLPPEYLNERATRTALVESYRGLATMRSITGELEESVALYERALRIQRGVVKADSLAPAPRALLASLLQELADVRGGAGVSNIGDTPGALAGYREARAIRESLLRATPADVDARAGLAVLLLNLGSLEWFQQEPSGEPNLREGVRMLEAIVAEHPDDAVRQNELLSGYGRLRVPLVDAGQYDAAIAIDRRVIASLERMSAADPQNTLLQRNLSVSYNSLARDFRATGQSLPAVQMHERALAISMRLHLADTSSVEHLRDVAFTEDVLAEALSDARRWNDALAMYARAIADKETLQRAEPSNPEHADDQAFLYAGLGAARMATGSLDAAQQAFDRAIPLGKAFVEHQPASPRSRSTLATVYAGLAQLHVKRAKCADAETWFTRAEAQWDTLASKDALTAAASAERSRAATSRRTCTG